MNFKQQRDDKMLFQTIGVYTENKGDFEAVPALAVAMERLIVIHADIANTVVKQIADTKGTTKTKVGLKVDLASVTFKMAGNIYSWAKNTNNNVVMGQSALTLGRLKKVNDQLMAPTCTNILNLAIANADALVNFGVTADSIQRLSQLIDAFTKLSIAPLTKKKDRSGFTQKLIDLFAEADELLKESLDKLVMNIEETKPDTFKSYQAARIVQNGSSGNNDVSPTPPSV